MRRGKLGAILWALCFQYFVAEQAARLAWKAPYSFSRNFISDLGAVGCGIRVAGSGGLVCSPLHGLMNASFVLQGLLIFFGAVLVRKFFAPGWVTTLAVGLLALSGLGVLAVGVAPEDVNLSVHDLGAAIHFLGGNAGMLLLGFALLRWPRSELVGWAATIVFGFVGLAGTLLLFSDRFLGLGVGGMERVAAYPLPVWLTGMGVTLLAKRRPDDAARGLSN